MKHGFDTLTMSYQGHQINPPSIDQSYVIVFMRAYWPHDNNFDHVTFYCGWQKPSAQCNGHWAESTFTEKKIILNDILAAGFDLDM